MQFKCFKNYSSILVFILLAMLFSLVSAETKIDLKDTSIYGDQEKPVVELDIPWQETDMNIIEPQPLSDLFEKDLKSMLKNIFKIEVNSASLAIESKISKKDE